MNDSPQATPVVSAVADAGRADLSPVYNVTALPPGRHVYLSSACWHAREGGQEHLHRYCQTNATRYDGTEKVAATCKFCPSPCICPCHGVPASGRDDGSSDGEPQPDPGPA